MLMSMSNGDCIIGQNGSKLACTTRARYITPVWALGMKIKQTLIFPSRAGYIYIYIYIYITCFVTPLDVSSAQRTCVVGDDLLDVRELRGTIVNRTKYCE